MGHQKLHTRHGVVTRAELLASGLSPAAIKHRIAKERLHPVWRGVYAVGRPELTRYGLWMAAVLSCGPHAALSHRSAAAMWGIGRETRGVIEVTIPVNVFRRRPGITVHRSRHFDEEDITTRHGIPVTTATRALIDAAVQWPTRQLETAVNEADKQGLTNLSALHAALERLSPCPGAPPLRRLLTSQTFTLTDSELERLFLPITYEAGLSKPETQVEVNGFRVDFYWPDLGLVVETDDLRYHRTPAQQTRDRVRDQAHLMAGLTPLRFTHAQVAFQPGYVRAALVRVVRRLRHRA